MFSMFYQKDILTFNCAPRKQTRRSSLVEHLGKQPTEIPCPPRVWGCEASVENRWFHQHESILDHLRSSKVLQTCFKNARGAGPNIGKSSMLARLGHFFGWEVAFGKTRMPRKMIRWSQHMFRQVCLERRTQKHEYFDAHQTPKVISTATASRLINPSLSLPLNISKQKVTPIVQKNHHIQFNYIWRPWISISSTWVRQTMHVSTCKSLAKSWSWPIQHGCHGGKESHQTITIHQHA